MLSLILSMYSLDSDRNQLKRTISNRISSDSLASCRMKDNNTVSGIASQLICNIQFCSWEKILKIKWEFINNSWHPFERQRTITVLAIELIFYIKSVWPILTRNPLSRIDTTVIVHAETEN